MLKPLIFCGASGWTMMITDQVTAHRVRHIAPGIPVPLPALRRSRVDTRSATPVLDVTIPVFNEEKDLEECLRRLHGYLQEYFPHPFRITVADNASTDGTLTIAERLAREVPEVAVVHLAEKGRGNALRRVWLASDSPVLAYMDVDLSTDLAALAPLLTPLISGHSDLAIGTRLTRSSRVIRGPRREFISRSYNLLLRSVMGARFTDAQCGFKAIRADVARRILPYTQDNAWFFDTELLVLAERCGPLHVGSGGGRLQQRSRLPTGHRTACHGRGRLQWNRSLTHTGAVPAARGRG